MPVPMVVYMQNDIKLVAFLAISAIIVRFSCPSMRSIRFHGFYRFFAWEFLSALTVLNIQYSFHKPESTHQIISKLYLIVSLLLAIHGFQLLRKVGRPGNVRTDPTLFWVEKTTVLVTVGAYRYIRHPLYSSLIFLSAGAYLESPTRAAGALAFLTWLSLIIAAKVEEKENIQFFGVAYRAYMERTKMFIPFVI